MVVSRSKSVENAGTSSPISKAGKPAGEWRRKCVTSDGGSIRLRMVRLVMKYCAEQQVPD